MKKQLASILILSTAVLTTATAWAAKSPNWNYVQGSIISVSIDDDAYLKPTGIGLSASLLLNENIFIDGTYARLSDQDEGFDFDFTTLDLNIGYRHGVTKNTDVYASVGYLSFDVDVSSRFGSDGGSNDGLSAKIGTRSKLTDQFEVDVFLAHENFDEGSDNSLGLSAHYHFNKQFAIGAGIVSNGDDDQKSLSFRYSF